MTATPATTNTVPEPGAQETCVQKSAKPTPALWFPSVIRRTRPRSRWRSISLISVRRGSRERACVREFVLNSRLSPDSYMGIAHFSDPLGGPAEPVIVMRRYSGFFPPGLAGSERVRPVHDHYWQSPRDWRGIPVTLPGVRRSTTAPAISATYVQ